MCFPLRSVLLFLDVLLDVLPPAILVVCEPGNGFALAMRLEAKFSASVFSVTEVKYPCRTNTDGICGIGA